MNDMHEVLLVYYTVMYALFPYFIISLLGKHGGFIVETIILCVTKFTESP